ncbi:MAG: alpha-amylase family glycosyl hydrolase [Bacteroidota bacterium]
MEKEFGLISWAWNTNVYEVNTRQYTPEGTFQAFSAHLSRLAAMGVEVLWFMPITPISALHRKGSLGSYYACSSYTEVNPEFGSIHDFRSIVQQAHALGMKVIIDWVANHTGHDHVWTKRHPDFYQLNHEGKFFDAHGWDDVIDLNYENNEMRDAMIDAMLYWVKECNIDGFRCDMAMLTPVDFWFQARKQVEQEKHLFWLAELDPLEHPAYMQVFDAAYTWKWMHATNQFKDDGAQHIHSLHETLYRYGNMPQNTLPAWFTSNHDENSWNGTEYEKYGEMAAPLAVFSSTWSGIPLLYSGQELPNHKRLPFFDKDFIAWESHPSLHDFYSSLFHLRKNHASFRDPSANPVLLRNSIEHHVISFKRKSGYTVLFVLINFSPYDLQHIEVDLGDDMGEYYEIFNGEIKNLEGRYMYVDMKQWTYQVWKK